MRMKEVSERTGLTDRAVRLYIESGLLQPKEESNYAGRRSIHFSESDIAELEAIATLRRADFSITDIRQMKEHPESIGTILEANKEKLEADIESKKQILQSLISLDSTTETDYKEIAEHLRRSASRNTIPKEDSIMNFKDFQKLIKNRIFSVLAFALLIVGIVALTPLFIKTAFVANTEISSGGGYEYQYDFNLKGFIKGLPLLGAWLCMAIAAVMSFLYILKGKKSVLTVGGAFSILAIAALLLLPTEIRESLYRFEFIGYRHSFMWHILYAANASFDIFIKALKFIPPVISALLTAISFIKHRDIPDDQQ